MGEHLVLVFQFDPKHRVGQRLDHRCYHFNGVFFWQASLLPPISDWRQNLFFLVQDIENLICHFVNGLHAIYQMVDA
jgi:hypothetical protein